jgi:hypothetical protein
MEPAIHRGDVLVVTNTTDTFRVGEVVVYTVPGRDIPIVHRVVYMQERCAGRRATKLAHPHAFSQPRWVGPAVDKGGCESRGRSTTLRAEPTVAHIRPGRWSREMVRLLWQPESHRLCEDDPLCRTSRGTAQRSSGCQIRVRGDGPPVGRHRRPVDSLDGLVGVTTQGETSTTRHEAPRPYPRACVSEGGGGGPRCNRAVVVSNDSLTMLRAK